MLVSRNALFSFGCRCILTPNVNEFRMLVRRAQHELEIQLNSMSSGDGSGESRSGETDTPPTVDLVCACTPCLIEKIKMFCFHSEGQNTCGTECDGTFSAAELSFLLHELSQESLQSSESASDREARQLRALSVVLAGVTVLLKGKWDMICTGGYEVVRLEGEDCRGSLRRCGGQVSFQSNGV